MKENDSISVGWGVEIFYDGFEVIKEDERSKESDMRY